MEGFWGILKREMYYGKKFTSKGDLITAVESYISMIISMLRHKNTASRLLL